MREAAKPNSPADDFCSLLDRQEAADLLKISVRKLDQLKANREIACVVIGRSVRFSRTDLQKLVETNRVPASRN